MAITLDERANPSEQKIIKYAHILGSIQKNSIISGRDQDFLKEIFYGTMSIRYCDLTPDLTRLRAKIVTYAGINSGLINLNKGVVR